MTQIHIKIWCYALMFDEKCKFVIIKTKKDWEEVLGKSHDTLVLI